MAFSNSDFNWGCMASGNKTVVLAIIREEDIQNYALSKEIISPKQKFTTSKQVCY